MEAHFVHQADDGSLAVLGVLYREGNTANKNIAVIVANLPWQKGQTLQFSDLSLELNPHLPEQDEAYHYTGSLTTSPCTENVQWYVLREAVEVTAGQVKAISSRIRSNNRPVQQLNGRTISLSAF